MARQQKRTIRERLACWLGKHPELAKTWGPFPYPDAYHCVVCGRLDHLIDERVGGGIRYSCLEQWMEERGGY